MHKVYITPFCTYFRLELYLLHLFAVLSPSFSLLTLIFIPSKLNPHAIGVGLSSPPPNIIYQQAVRGGGISYYLPWYTLLGESGKRLFVTRNRGHKI